MIKAPFNFVPLNKTPYLPEWADQISQDIPFEDGLSGKIRLRITAETPIFVSDKVEEANTVPCEFCHISLPDGRIQYLIPGTSIKGVLRNVMEIISFGKMTQVQNQSFGIRDLSNGADGQFYRAKVKVDNVHCGWLRQGDDGCQLDDCGLPYRISAEEIDRKFKIGLTDFIQRKSNFKSDDNKTAQKKYNIFKAHADESLLTDYFEPTNIPGINAGGRKFVRFGHGGIGGTIVFTGQPGLRQKSSGKFFEFVFPSQIEESSVPVPEHVFKEFESIHQNSADYTKFRKDQLRSGEEIPVFFIYNEDGEVETMGLSYMYKFPAFNKVYNGIPLPLLSNSKRDLCECIFGYTSKEDSLKGRVQFAAASLCGEPSFIQDVTLALAKPHPSYYPLYLGKGQTWNSKNIEIAGKKRYPVRSCDALLQNTGTDKMKRIIRPMDAGAVFEGDIHFFNLRPVELGALLSAIDFCHHEDCSHSMGQGKPLGYGRVKMTVTDCAVNSVSADKSCSLSLARKLFETEMERHFPGWTTSTQLTELFAMAKGIPAEKASLFSYMKMSTTGEDNEFKQGLKAYSQGEQLGSFTQILSGNVPRVKQQSNVSVNAKRQDVELQLEQEQRKAEIAEAKAEEEKRQEQYRALIQQAEQYSSEGAWDKAFATLDEAALLCPDSQEPGLLKEKYREAQSFEQYRTLIQQAEQYSSEGAWDKAFATLDEAALLCPDSQEPGLLKEKYREAQSLEAFQRSEQEAALQKLSQPLAEVIKGKTSSVGNLIGTTLKWLKGEGNSFGPSEYEAFLNGISQLPPKEKPRLKSKRKDLVKAIGEELTNKLFTEIGI